MRKVIAVFMLLFLGFGNVNSSFAVVNTPAKTVIGNWIFTVADAPYGYKQGKVEIFKNDGEFKAKIHRSDDYVFLAENMKIEGSKISFEATIEGESISVFLVLKNNLLDGKVISNEGSLSINMKREPKSKQ